MTTYANFAAKTRSEKLVICHIEPTQRLQVWTLDAGAVYKRTTDYFVIRILEGTTALTEGTSSSLSSGEFWYDADSSTCYIRTSDDSDPSTKNIVADYRLFYANTPLDLPYDLLNGSGVHYEGALSSNSPIVKQLDEEAIGIALESSTNVKFNNQDGSFDEFYDTLFFENKPLRIYSWNESILLSEKKLLFDGIIQDKTFSTKDVGFKCKDFMFKLREPLSLPLFSSSDGNLSDNDLNTPKRRIYGEVLQAQCVGIDKTLDGYSLTGTVSASSGSSVITGVGTSFLDEVSPNDKIIIDLTQEVIELSVDSVDSDTQITTTEEIELDFAGNAAVNSPVRAWRKKNRNWHISGHKLRAPSTTVSAATQPNRFSLVDSTDFLDDDTVKVDGEGATIKRISNGDVVLTANLQAGTPSIGDAVEKNPVSKAYIGQNEIIIDRDWTLTNTTEAILNLTETAEFNVARSVNMLGTFTFTNGSRSVTVTGIDLLNEVRTRDWIKGPDIGHTPFYEILSVSESSLELRTVYAGSNITAAGAQKKNVELVSDDSLILVNTIGKETSGAWMKTASDCVRDMLIGDAGLSVNEASFSQADIEAPQKLSLVIPESIGGQVPKIRDVITKINESILGSLVNNSDWELVYSVLTSEKPTDLTPLEDDDVVGEISVRSRNEIIRKANIKYSPFVDRFTGSDAFKLESYTNDFVDDYIGIKSELDKTLYLFEQDDALEMAQRYALYNSLSQSTVSLKSKLNLSLKNLNDKLYLSFDRLYKRFGGRNRQKIGIITKVSKNGSDTNIELNDLGNVFNRVMSVADDSSNDFTSATDSEKIVNSYVCDDTLNVPNITDDEFLGTNIIG